MNPDVVIRRWFPQFLAARLALTLSVTLLLSYAVMFGLWRSQLETAVVPSLAASLGLIVENVRDELQQRAPEQREQWIDSFNRRGNLELHRRDAGGAIAVPRSKLMLGLQSQLQMQLGAGTHLQMRTLGSRRVTIDFDAANDHYEVGLPSTLVMGRSWPLLGLLITLGGLLWAALLFVVWQVNRPLERLLAALAGSSDRLESVHMPESAPEEFRSVARRFNALAADLSEQERERRLVLAGVSHDLRTPLTRMRMRAELLDDDRARQGLIRDADAMARIIDQFLDYHRESSRSAAPATAVDVGEIVDRIVRGFSETGHPVQAMVGPSGQRVSIEVLALERLVGNLIDNALSHGAPPVQVNVTTTKGRVEVSVRDHGPGIPPADIPRLLKPFERLDAARGAQGHCGLGLAIVTRLATPFGGRLELLPAEGGGLQAIISFPVAAVAAEPGVRRSIS